MKIKPAELNFLKNDPGAVKHGNFINYYDFNSVKSRIDNLDDKMFPKSETNTIVVLDVGCNSGNLTVALHNYLSMRFKDCTIEILAVDVDPKLIENAKKTATQCTIKYETANIMDVDGRGVIQKYLEKHKKQNFDITFCFSVIMWIHLNNGDEGLLDFLKYIQSISALIVIEVQPWKCYKSAQKRLKKAGSTFENYSLIKIRKDVDTVIESTIIKDEFSKTYESSPSVWGRKIQCFQNTVGHLS